MPQCGLHPQRSPGLHFGLVTHPEYSTSLCSGGSSSDAATGSDPDWLPVAGFRDAPV